MRLLAAGGHTAAVAKLLYYRGFDSALIASLRDLIRLAQSTVYAFLGGYTYRSTTDNIRLVSRSASKST